MRRLILDQLHGTHEFDERRPLTVFLTAARVAFGQARGVSNLLRRHGMLMMISIVAATPPDTGVAPRL